MGRCLRGLTVYLRSLLAAVVHCKAAAELNLQTMLRAPPAPAEMLRTWPLASPRLAASTMLWMALRWLSIARTQRPAPVGIAGWRASWRRAAWAWSSPRAHWR